MFEQALAEVVWSGRSPTVSKVQMCSNVMTKFVAGAIV